MKNLTLNFILFISASTILQPLWANAYYFTLPIDNSAITAWFDHDLASALMTKYTGEVFSGSGANSGTCTDGCYDEHNGTDFAGSSIGEDILAPYKGEVEDIWWNNCGGWQMHIWHDDINLSTLYSHIATSTIVNINDYVDRGDHIAEMDNTGSCSSGAHLHFGVTDGQSTSTSNRIDPFGWFGTSTDPWTHNQGYLWTTNPPSFLPYISKSGSITTDETWTEGNTYVIDDTLFVEYGSVLTVEPGVIVKFDSPAEIYVNGGTLNAHGTVGKPIYFTSLRDDSIGGDTNDDGSLSVPAPGNWLGITAGGDVDIAESVIRYGYTNITNWGTTLTISSSTLSNAIYGMGLSGGLTTASSVDIYDNDIGVSVFGASININDSRIGDNRININAQHDVILELSDSEIYGASEYGIRMAYSTSSITNTEFYDNQYGINISQYGSTLDTFSNNSFENNVYGLVNNASSSIVNAENNYWGHSSGPSGFGLGSGDYVSDYVDFTPWLTSW